MYIFIDEAGPFIPTPNRVVSTMAAVVVPENCMATLFRRYRNLTRDWKRAASEAKASSMDEAQVAAALALIRRFDILAFVYMIDMGTHTREAVEADKQEQADKLAAPSTPEVHPRLREWMETCAQALRRLPPQLYLQSVMMRELVADVLDRSTLYYAQRIPSTLGKFAWRLDAKDLKLTLGEKLWLEIVSPLLQTRSLYRPMRSAGSDMKEADYRAMARFAGVQPKAPPHLRRGVVPRTEPFHYLDIDVVMRENIRCVQSHRLTGLQIADLVATTFRRACNNKLDERGWRSLGRILLQAERGRSPLINVQIGQQRANPERPHYIDVTERLRGGQKRMLVRSVHRT